MTKLLLGDGGFMELWDAYDEDFNIIEDITLVRGEEEKIPEGIFHLVVDILVKHKNGTYLLMLLNLYYDLKG